MLYPKKCCECGGVIKPVLDEAVNILIPTCLGCGEGYLDGELIKKLDKIFQEQGKTLK